MVEKDKDLFLDMLENPNLTLEDMVSVGHSAESTRFLDKSVYENSQRVRNKFMDSEGNFKQDEFNRWYSVAADAYQKITDKDTNLSLLNVTAFNESDITVSPDKRTLNTKPIVSFSPNPDRLSTSIFRIGKTSERERTLSELAQAEKVLLNPVEAAQDPSKARWGDSPNDSWWGNFFDTLVLAQWDEDGEHIDPVTKKKTTHKKGELKLNDNGTYYYEALDGRDIYGRLVLNKFNTITTDGTFWNQYDFFDSDDIKEKSFVGSVAKNLALVGSMFIPYVGWGIAGASVATQVVGLAGTLGKMLTGSDSPTFSAMEGWSKSLNRQGAKSEYAQQNMLCWENFIDLIGDTTAQLREQRAIFKFAPAIFGKGKYGIESKHFGMNSEALKAKEAASLAKLATPNLNTLNMARAVGAETSEEAIAAIGKANATKDWVISNIADDAVKDYLKNYNKLGELIARGYMVGITVGDTYGEAKEAGATDFEATMLTLGYAAAENKLLSSELGRWIFPELKAERATMAQIGKVLTKTPETLSEKGIASTLRSSGVKNTRAELLGKRIAEMPLDVREASQALNKLDDTSRLAWMKKWFNAGKEVFDTQKSVMKGTLGAALASALAEGTEEVSEELLKDFSTSCFNLVKAAQGNKDVRMQGFLGTWDWNQALKRYGMSFFGGAIGGGINSAAYDYKQFKDIANMTSDLAMQLLVWMDRNGEMDKFWDVVSKETLGDKYHSTEQNEDGTYKLGDANNNLDLEVKKALRQQIDMIHNILAAKGASIDDDGLIGQIMTALPSSAKNHDVLGDFRANALATSVTAGRFLKEYNNLCKAIVVESINLKKLLDLAGDTASKVPNDLQTAISESEESLKALQDAKDKLLNGERTAEFFLDALFEVTYGVSESFIDPTEVQFAERLYKKPYSLLTKEEKEDASKKYATWSTTERAEQIHTLAGIFYDSARNTSLALQQSSEMYQKLKDNLLLKVRNITDLSSNKLMMLREILEENPENALERALEILSNLSRNSRSNQANPLGILVDPYDEYEFGKNQLMSDVQESVGDPGNAFPAVYLQIIDDPTLNNEEKLQVLVNVFLNTIHNELTKTAEEIISTGYIHPEVKRDLLPTLQLTLKYYENLNLGFLDRMEIQNEEGSPELADNAAKVHDQINEMAETLKLQIDQINELSYTPISENLKNFALSTGADLTVLSLLESTVTKETAYQESLNDLLLSETDEAQFDEAEKLLKLYRASIIAARHDNADILHIFGYNKTLNELCHNTDGWVDLAEIDADTANLALEDVNMALNRLATIRGISTLNQGNKLNVQNHTAANKNFILFNRTNQALTTLLNEDDDEAKAVAAEWLGLDELKDAIDAMEGHKLLTGETLAERTLSLNPDLKEIIERELHAMDDAIYEFFLKNKDKLTDSETATASLAKLFKAMKLDFYHRNEGLLTQNSEGIDDNAYVWWLASKAAMKSSDFHKEYRKVISEDIAPIPTLELGVYAAIAAIHDGNVFNAFGKAARKYIYDDWSSKTKEQRIETIAKNNLSFKRNGADYRMIEFEDSEMDKLYLSELMPNFTNILFIEGVPGSGKSTGVFKTIAKMLNNLNEGDNSWLPGPVVVAHSNQDNAEKLAGSLGFNDGTRVIAHGKEELLSWMSSEYRNRENPETSQYEYHMGTDCIEGEDGVLHSTWKVHQLPALDVPSVIFIDEWSRYTLPEVDLINRFASEYGVQVIAGGDMDQLSPVAYLLKTPTSQVKDDDTEEMSNSRNIVARVPKLGISMRTGNGQKTRNLHVLQEKQRNLKNTDPVDLLYVETQDDLYGDKVYLAGPEITDAQLQEIRADIDKLIANLDTENHEKIGFIYSDTDSKLFQLLNSAPYKDKIDFKSESAALGLEGRYYIVENNRKETQDAELYLKSLYTGISRAEQASIVIAPNYSIGGLRVERPRLQENKLIPDNFTSEGIARFATQRRDLLDVIYDSEEDTTPMKATRRSPNPIPLIPKTPGVKLKTPEELEAERKAAEEAQRAAGALKPQPVFLENQILGNGANFVKVLGVEEGNPGEYSYKIDFGDGTIEVIPEQKLLENSYGVYGTEPPAKGGEEESSENPDGTGENPEETPEIHPLEVTTENLLKIAGAINAASVPSGEDFVFTPEQVAGLLGVKLEEITDILTEMENLGIISNDGDRTLFHPDKLNLAETESLEEEAPAELPSEPPTPKYIAGDTFKIGTLNDAFKVSKVEWNDDLKAFLYTLMHGTLEITKFEELLDSLAVDNKYIPKGYNETPDGRTVLPELPELSFGNESLLEILEELESEQAKEDPEIVVSKNGDIDYKIYGYTLNTNYLGVPVDDQGNLVPPQEGEKGSKRIDNANGLIKLMPTKFRTPEACRKALGIIRKSMQFDSNDDILKVIKSQIPALKNLELKLEWAFISKAEEHRTGDGGRFYYDSKLRLDNMEDFEHAEIPRKMLSGLVFDEAGNCILEIPMVSLGSPFTALYKLGQFDPKNKIFTEYEKARKEERDPHKVMQRVAKAILKSSETKDSEGKLLPGYLKLHDMCTLWQFSSDGVLFISQQSPGNPFNLARDTHNLGSKYIKDRQTEATICGRKPKYDYSRIWHDLTEEAKRLDVKYSSIMLATDDRNALGYRVAPAGHTFVLRSDSNKFATDKAMMDQYFKLLKDPTEPKYVTLELVAPPQCTVLQYLAEQMNKGRQNHYGNEFTAYRILSIVKQLDPNLWSEISVAFRNKMAPILETLRQIEESTPKLESENHLLHKTRIWKALKKVMDDKGAVDLFLDALFDLTWGFSGEDLKTKTPNMDVINRIAELCAKDSSNPNKPYLEGVLYNPVCVDRKDAEVVSGYGILVQTGENKYTNPDGLSFRIYSRYDTPKFDLTSLAGRIGSWIGQIEWQVTGENGTVYRNLQRFKNSWAKSKYETSGKSKKPKGKSPNLKLMEKHAKLLENLGLKDYDKLKSISDETKFLEAIRDKFIETPGNVALVVNGKKLVYTNLNNNGVDGTFKFPEEFAEATQESFVSNNAGDNSYTLTLKFPNGNSREINVELLAKLSELIFDLGQLILEVQPTAPTYDFESVVNKLQAKIDATKNDMKKMYELALETLNRGLQEGKPRLLIAAEMLQEAGGKARVLKVALGLEFFQQDEIETAQVEQEEPVVCTITIHKKFV